MLIRPLHPPKAALSIFFVPSGITMLVRLLLPLKAYPPMLVALLWIFTLVRPLQLLNALAPILITPSGISILGRLVQLPKA